MLRAQVRLVLLIQALGLRACNTPGRGERGHLQLQHLPREAQPPGDPEWLGSTWLPPEAKREGKAPLHWFLMLMVGIHSGARPCGKAKMPSLVSSLSPRYRKEMGGLEVKQPAKTTAEAPAASTTVRLLSEPRP